jgi:hypothetical protein
LNPAVAALSAVAICDALNSIGVLGWPAGTSSADGVFDRKAANSQEAKTHPPSMPQAGLVTSLRLPRSTRLRSKTHKPPDRS